MKWWTTTALVALSFATISGSDLAAQVEITPRAASIRIGGRLHSQFATSTAEAGKSLDFFNRRARLTIDIKVSDRLDGRVQPDFSGGKFGLKDAYFRVRFSSAFRVSFGQLKQAFDLFELDSSTEMAMVERAGRISGVNSCAGVGGVCTLSRFTEKLAYSGRDAGVKFDGTVSDRITYAATITNGTGTTGADVNDAKSFSGRVSFAASDNVVLSANAAVHDYLTDDEATHRGSAFGGDIDVGSFRSGTTLKVGLIAGDNWKAREASGRVPSFLTGQAVIARYVPLEDHYFAAIEPMARISWGDPDRDAVDDGGMLFTPGLMAYLNGRNRIGLNLDVYRAQGGDTDYSLKIQTFLFF